MPWMPACPSDVGMFHGPLDPIAVVLHRTYGSWPGDYSVGKQGIFHFLIGKDDGRWVQFAPTEVVQYHCNGANFRAVGIELEGTNEDVLTGWQSARLGDVLRWLHTVHNIPLDYLDPGAVPAASVHVNDGTFRGVISHISVRTDDGSAQHTDLVTAADYTRALGTETADMTPDEHALLVSIADTVQKLANAVFDPTIGLQHRVVNDLPAQLEAVQKDLDARIGAAQSGIPAGGLTVTLSGTATPA